MNENTLVATELSHLCQGHVFFREDLGVGGLERGLLVGAPVFYPEGRATLCLQTTSCSPR